MQCYFRHVSVSMSQRPHFGKRFDGSFIRIEEPLVLVILFFNMLRGKCMHATNFRSM